MKRYTEATDKKWFSLSIEETAQELESNLDAGLANQVVSSRLESFGANALPKSQRKSALIRFLEHFNDILIYILFAAAAVSALLGHYLDAGVIFLVAFINASIGFIQENKAEKAIDDLKELLSPKAQVKRDGDRSEIDAADLVPGDVVLLSAGDREPEFAKPIGDKRDLIQ